MQQENYIIYNTVEDLDENLNINFEKLWKTFWNRKELLVKVFCSVLVFFVLLTFILPKKYKVGADLYINKSNSSNMEDVNPYALDDASGAIVAMGSDKSINNEIELMKSALVLDDVIRDNNIKYKKGKRKGEYISAKAFYRKGKKLSIKNIKNTNVISVEYTARTPESAYGVVSSLIANYIELHKEINSEKSKFDKKLIEEEYEKTKENLINKLNQANGLPVQTMSGIGNLSAMSAFSKSASLAIGNIKNQYVEGEKLQISVATERKKLTDLASKLEWAKMVEKMSDSSKVLVINEPLIPLPNENSSPKLLVNIILGCLFGFLASIAVLIYKESNSAKLTYSMLTDNIIYDGIDHINDIRTKIRCLNSVKVLAISLIQLPEDVINAFQNMKNTSFTYFSSDGNYIDQVAEADKIILISKINVSDTSSYKTVKEVVKNQKKDVLYDILI